MGGGATSPKYWPLNGTLDFLCIASAGINDDATGISPTCTWGEGSGTAANVAKKVVVTVPTNASTFDDILYGSANAQPYSTTGTAIDFRHAECAVVFLAKSSVEYDSSDNVGITITDITVNNALTVGTLTVSNPKAGNNTSGAALSAVWSSLTTTADVKARVWDGTNTGVNASEPNLDSSSHKLDLGTTYKDSGANVTPPATTPTALTTYFFGDAYVILPPQNAASFTISYTLHNGKKANGDALDHNFKYKYTPTSGETWEMGKKVIYLIDITQHEILIKPTVTNWDETFKTAVIN